MNLHIRSFGLVIGGFAIGCGGSDVSIGVDNPDAAQGGDTSNGTDGGNIGEGGSKDSSSGNDASSFDPGSVSGLALWLDANKGITQSSGSVSGWADRTANKNDASQATASHQPQWLASSINGLPAVHFNKDHAGQFVGGDALTIADSVSLQWGTGDFYVVVVGRFDGNVTTDGPERGEGVFFSKTAGGNNFPGPLLLAGIFGSINGGKGPANGVAFTTSTTNGDYVITTNPYNDSTARSFAMRRTGKQLELRINGASIVTSASSGLDISNVGATVRIGAGDQAAASLRLDGDVAELLAVKGALSAGDMAALELYVKTKYGL